MSKSNKVLTRGSLKKCAFRIFLWVLSVILAASSAYFSFGARDQRNAISSLANTHPGIKGIAELKEPKTVHVKSSKEAGVNELRKIPAGKQPEENTGQNNSPASAAATEVYNMAYLKSLSYDEMITKLASIKWTDIPDLFQFNKDALDFYNDKSRVQALIDAIEQRGKSFTAADIKGMDTLIEVLRAGFFLGYNNTELKSLNDRTYHEKCIPAIKAIEKNSNFKLGTLQQDELVKATGLLIWNSASDAECVNLLTPVLKDFASKIKTYLESNSKGSAIYNIMGGVEYDIKSYTDYEKRISPSQTPWYGKIDSYIDQLGTIATKGISDNKNLWISNNSIYFLGCMGRFHSNTDKGNEYLTSALGIYEYLSYPYFQAVQEINEYYNGKDFNGKLLDMVKIREEGKSKYLPKNYSFDDGSIKIRAGSNVAEDKIKRLYWATKEAGSQFFRIMGSDRALEPDKPDKVLTIVIYNTPSEYPINQFLYGFGTDNGGLYIEGDGTFFTYERTPEESIYTLEELFRHEFTHYLQGRFLVPGLWGDGEIYSNDRLTWFEEGNAEFNAGSTRTSGVLPRKSVVSNFAGKSQAQRYTLSKTLHSGYSSGWDFYHYSFAFMDYMYNNRLDILNSLADYIRTNNVSGYDSYIKQLSADTELEKAYQSHMQKLSDNADKLTVPLVSDDCLALHPYKSLTDIVNEITKAASIKNTTYSTSTSQYFRTFTLEGDYTGDISKGKASDWSVMNQKLDNILKKLETGSWTGYKTVTGYFTDYSTTADNKYKFRVVFRGIMTDDKIATSTPTPPQTKIPVPTPTPVNPKGITGETEPNNDFIHANGYIMNGVKVEGSFNSQDSKDVYYFNVNAPGSVAIKLEKNGDAGINWLLYHESDTENYVAYPAASGSILEGTYKAAKTGRYYLVAYKHSGTDSTYKVNVLGPIDSSTPVPTSTPTKAPGFTVEGFINPGISNNNAEFLSDFKVSIPGINVSAATDTKGYFKFTGVPMKTDGYTLIISKGSYLLRTISALKVNGNIVLGSQNSPLEIWAGDINADDAINMSDIMKAASVFNSSEGYKSYDSFCDINKDGTVNMTDIMVIAKHYGKIPKDYPQYN